ncbi:ATP-binding protein [Streptomyces sp. NPDC045431]|uniref:ATP-binding protein n=1 Tax=Streptomyces sp. NPDC045431 TaxID=3155613 RepID=UPI00340977D0
MTFHGERLAPGVELVPQRGPVTESAGRGRPTPRTDQARTGDGRTGDGRTGDGRTDDGRTDDGRTDDGRTDDGRVGAADPQAAAADPPPGAARYPVASEEDLLAARHAVRAATIAAGFGLVDQTRIVTAASELARNAYVHGGGGTLEIQLVATSGRRGLRLTVRDQGPGIPDVEKALADGFTTGTGLGHGLGGARRLMHEFQVRSAPGGGTTVIVTRWNDR